jgi:hypothetical protein
MALPDPCRPGSALHRQDNAGRDAGSDGTSFTPPLIGQVVVGVEHSGWRVHGGWGGVGQGFAPGFAIGFGGPFFGG